ncbi:MAG: redoxin domain-containing protein [candidate division KSB1 bacterium]|nr:redoxin domain-containing protein [candidate division KSB1 bacterium]
MAKDRLIFALSLLLLCLSLIFFYRLVRVVWVRTRTYRALAQELRDLRDPTRRADGSSVVGSKLPDFLLPDMEGKMRKIAVPASYKVVILLAPEDCPTCLEESSLWRRIDEAYPDTHVAVLGIAHGHRARQIKYLLRRERLGFPVLVDTANLVAESLGLRSSPLRLLVDGEGTILSVERSAGNPQAQAMAWRRLVKQIGERGKGKRVRPVSRPP